MKDLKGKKILFIGSGFYYYDKAIIKELENFGATIRYVIEFTESYSLKLKKKISSSYYDQSVSKRENELLNLFNKETFDFIFVIRAQYLSPRFFEKLSGSQKNAKFILYLWDSVSTTRDFDKKEKYFDKILSFDREDSLKYQRISFRPLFYLKEYYNEHCLNRSDSKRDLYFLGRLYGDRISVLRKIWKECITKGLKSKMVLYAPLNGDTIRSFLRYFIRKNDFRIISFKQLPLVENIREMQSSISILDVELVYQSGLTIRTIETIGSNRKLITTNKDIIHYDFYDPGRILIIDRARPVIPAGFISEPMKPYEKEILDKYSITGWAKEIFA